MAWFQWATSDSTTLPRTLGDHVDEVVKQDFRDLAVGAGHEVLGDGVARVDPQDALTGLALVFVWVGEGGVGDGADLLAGDRNPPYAPANEVLGEVIYQEGGGVVMEPYSILPRASRFQSGRSWTHSRVKGGLGGEDAASGLDGFLLAAAVVGDLDPVCPIP